MMIQPAAQFASSYAAEHARVLDQLPWDRVSTLISELATLRDSAGMLFLAGNGGSATTASHFAVDFSKGVAAKGQAGIRTFCLSDSVSTMTALANDISYEEVFATPLTQLSKPGDGLLVISASGRSPNILRALEVASAANVTTFALLGMGGGPAADLATVGVVVPSDDYGVIEDAHLFIGHAVTAFLRDGDQRSW